MRREQRDLRDMVDDPNTDPVYIWTPTRASFVVWDAHRLSTDVLPRILQATTISPAFIRPAQHISVRKIDSDRWEFAKRRRLQQVGIGHKWVDSCNEAQAELASLGTIRTLLKMEIMRLKQQQETTDNHLAMVRERIGEHGEQAASYCVLRGEGV
nr:heat stress transcription factor A-2-like [Ipomoea batatas]